MIKTRIQREVLPARKRYPSLHRTVIPVLILTGLALAERYTATHPSPAPQPWPCEYDRGVLEACAQDVPRAGRTVYP